MSSLATRNLGLSPLPLTYLPAYLPVLVTHLLSLLSQLQKSSIPHPHRCHGRVTQPKEARRGSWSHHRSCHCPHHESQKDSLASTADRRGPHSALLLSSRCQGTPSPYPTHTSPSLPTPLLPPLLTVVMTESAKTCGGSDRERVPRERREQQRHLQVPRLALLVTQQYLRHLPYLL